MKKTTETKANKAGKKSKSKKEIELDTKKIANRLGGKSFFVLNLYNFQHLDLDNTGKIFYNINDRVLYQKWEFIVCEDGSDIYLIRNIAYNLFMTSDSKGELFSISNDKIDEFMKWKILKTTEIDIYAVTNYGNGFYLNCNKMNGIFLDYQKIIKDSSLFYLYPKKIKK